MNRCLFSRFSCAAVVMLAGCRMSAPVHVWQPPRLESTVGKKVAVSAVIGPDDLAKTLQRQLIESAPQDAGRQTTLIDSAELQSQTKIQLVSATDSQPSDVAIASVARRAGFDYVLRGEVLAERYPRKESAEKQPLTLSWRLTPLKENRPVGGKPVIVDLESAVDQYPDLALVGDPERVLTTAAVRETYRLITPSIERDRVQLAIPYFLPGSKEARRGNVAARAGRWGEAKQIWSDVVDKYPLQVGALNNLALAAAAEQDFSTAKRLARKAIRRQPSELHQDTLVWIELRQRDYHRAFNLPDPPEGWFVTSRQSSVVSRQN